MIVNNEATYDCPECGLDGTVIEVEFSNGYAAPEGIPGLLCYQCGNKLGLEDIDGGYNDRI